MSRFGRILPEDNYYVHVMSRFVTRGSPRSTSSRSFSVALALRRFPPPPARSMRKVDDISGDLVIDESRHSRRVESSPRRGTGPPRRCILRWLSSAGMGMDPLHSTSTAIAWRTHWALQWSSIGS